ncbi:hypothetical protein [Streptomyces murinus]|uniref:hypothetical protein n=1 Tax=Streptomyces murinus TaxID=33900 RepID=UPI0037FA71A0
MRTAVELCPFGLSLNVTLDPPLKPTGGQSEAHGTGTLANCVGLPLGLKNAVIVGDGRATVGPTGQELTGTAAFVWSNGAVDHFTFTVSTDPVNPKFSAVVTDGPLAGDTATGIGPFVPATDASGSVTGFTVTGATVTFLPV